MGTRSQLIKAELSRTFILIRMEYLGGHIKREVSCSALYFSGVQVGLSNGKGEASK